MKTLVLFLTMMVQGTQVFAAATLRVPFILVNDHDGKTAPVARLNQKLLQAGLPTLPEYIEISNSSNGYNLILKAEAKLKNSLQALGENTDDIRLEGGLYPTHADIGNYKTCYRGDFVEAAQIAQTLTDVFYSDQMTLHAVRFGKEMISLEEGTELDDPDTQDWLSKSLLWKNWTGANSDLLILSSVSDGGDDIQESLIPVCR